MTYYVYRAYDSSDALLYIGQCGHPWRRMTGHMSKSKWCADVACVRIQPFATRAEAFDAERAAIIAEKPKFNTVHLIDGYRAFQPAKHAEMSDEESALATLIGGNIRTARRRLGLTLDDMAAACDISRVTIHKYESGARIPKFKRLQVISRALGVPVSELNPELSVLAIA